jgi:hypothetical protein
VAELCRCPTLKGNKLRALTRESYTLNVSVADSCLRYSRTRRNQELGDRNRIRNTRTDSPCDVRRGLRDSLK